METTPPTMNSNGDGTNASGLLTTTTTTTTVVVPNKMEAEDGSSTAYPPRPICRLQAQRLGPQCPFGNDHVRFTVFPGGCIWLRGTSGRGKSTIAMSMALSSQQQQQQQRLQRNKLHVNIQCDWDPLLEISQRCGILFQQTALIDELTVAGNLAVAIRACTTCSNKRQQTTSLSSHAALSKQQREQEQRRIKDLLSMVGLDYGKDGHKRITELSGGMARRVGLAVQLAQNKHVIVLDEPFTGLDPQSATSIAKVLVSLRRSSHRNVALILISHEEHYAQVVMEPTLPNNVSITLTEPTAAVSSNCNNNSTATMVSPPSLLYGTQWMDRFVQRLLDYILYSIPLIVCTFAATGTAIAMISADSLRRLDVTSTVLAIVDKEVRPMIQLLTGTEPSVFTMMGVRIKINQMLQETIPPAKVTLYSMGICQLFVLEIGPLLTALLLCGRIGGSYAGRVATLASTNQMKLLQTLSISILHWSFTPSLLAAILAGPVLTTMGTVLALVLAGYIGPMYYSIGTTTEYWSQVKSTLFPPLRLQGWSTSRQQLSVYQWEYYKTTYSTYWIDTLIEIVTYPILYPIIKAIVFACIITGVAELCARIPSNLTPRGVPTVITNSVVWAGLIVIVADWAFSQLWLQRH